MQPSQSTIQPLQPTLTTHHRLLSLDFMRGLIMVLLALESAGLYDYLSEWSKGSSVNVLLQQFFHHPWHGLHLWDLVQPAFMFMAGVALAYSLHKQRLHGLTWSQTFSKTLRRCWWLFFWGVFDYAVTKNGLKFWLWDVLTQLSFTTLVAFLIFNWSYAAQALVCVGLLLLTEVLYRFTHVPNFDQPFTDQHNFGNYIDLKIMNYINPDGWVAINCIPTAVHTIAGAMVGKLLLSKGSKKLQPMLIGAVVCLVVGYALDLGNITPIIKRIATSSFTLVSLGWVLLMLSVCYWWIDIKDHRKYMTFFLIIGTNSLFIYLFFEIVGHRWFTEYITFIVTQLFGFIHAPEMMGLIVAALTVFGLEWALCYWLYRKKIFFKL